MNAPTVRLYHHGDGYPSFMGPKLERFMKAISKILAPYRVGDSEYVAALMVKLASDDYNGPAEPNTQPVEDWIIQHNGMLGSKSLLPFFLPTCVLHWDIEYLWVIKLGGKGKKRYKIECYIPQFSWGEGVPTELIGRKKINWRAEAKKGR